MKVERARQGWETLEAVAGNVQPTRAQIVAERGQTKTVPAVTAFPTQHYNGITSWAIDGNGEVRHVYA